MYMRLHVKMPPEIKRRILRYLMCADCVKIYTEYGIPWGWLPCHRDYVSKLLCLQRKDMYSSSEDTDNSEDRESDSQHDTHLSG